MTAMAEAIVKSFFLETCQCGPAAVGEWQPGETLYQEFLDWGEFADTDGRNGRLRFYETMRSLGFAQHNGGRARFFVPKPLEG
jgi:hypothetical protein